MEHRMPKLKDILLPRLRLILSTELLRQNLASRNVLRADEVDGDFDTICEVADLSDDVAGWSVY